MTQLLPTVVALAFLGALLAGRLHPRASRLSGLAASGDLVWCAVALLAKAGTLYVEASARMGPAARWFDLGWVAVLIAVLTLLPSRWRAATSFAIVAVASIWIWGDAVHYRFFEDVASVATLRAAGNASMLWESVVALSYGRDAWLFIDLAAQSAPPAAATVWSACGTP